MRKILFRAKRDDNGEWVEGNLIQMNSSSFQIFIFPFYEFASTLSCGKLVALGMMAVDRSTVGQYTGLTDKNGKRIFEDDIVNIVYPDTTVRNAFINYVGASFYGDNGNDLWELDGCVCLETIGNIHDNPELLQGDKS